MVGVDTSRPFSPLNLAVLTISDSRTPDTDRSGQTLMERAKTAGHLVVHYEIVPDDQNRIEATLRRCISDPSIDVVLSTGGTGVTGRDVTPEAFQAVYEKNTRLWRVVSVAKLPKDPHVDDSVARHRRGGGGHLPLLLTWLDGGCEGCVG